MATTGRGGTGPPAPALLARALGVPPQGPVHRAARMLLTLVATGAALLLVLLAAASASLVPGQLDDAGRQACATARGLPGQAERTTAVALVTDLDAGLEGGSPVTQSEVFRVFGESTARLRALLLDVAAALPLDRDCPCGQALDGTSPDLVLP